MGKEENLHSFSPQSSAEMSVEDLFNKLGDLMLLDEWVNKHIVRANNKEHPYHFAVILEWQIATVLKQSYYDWQGRRKMNKDQLSTDLADIVAMSLATIVAHGCDVYKVFKLAMERFEGKPDYQTKFKGKIK